MRTVALMGTKQFESLTAKPGRHWVGGARGLYLLVGGETRKSWLLRVLVNGKRREIGLGSYPGVTLATARKLANQHLDLIALGVDPVADREANRAKSRLERVRRKTFAECANLYLEAKVELKEGGFKNAKHRQQWRNTIETYANPVIGNLDIAHIDTDLVLRVLQQDVADKAGVVVGSLWNTKTETASRLRGRIEAVLSWAAFRGLRPQGDNPARWKGHLDNELPARSLVAKVTHHASLPYEELGGFMSDLRKREALSARALEFAILTAARAGEVRESTWNEIDLEARIWTVPAARMKMKRAHEVPLSDAAVSLLKALPRFALEAGQSDYVFPNKPGKALSENAGLKVLERMDRADLTQHGFRSTFRDWVAERTSYPRELAEYSLAHGLPDKVEAAYQRRTLLPERRKLMAEWAAYCGIIQHPTGNVVGIREGSAA